MTQESSDTRIPAALRPMPGQPRGSDPLKYCIFTTVALLAWLGGPFVVTLMAAVGVVAYGRTVARGQRSTRCLLRDTRLVLAYLAVTLVAGLCGVVRAVT